MNELNLELLLQKSHIRTCEVEGTTYFSVIDILADLRESDFKTAQNYYHVVKGRMNRNGITIPDLRKIKAKTVNRKLYFTDFTTKEGISVLLKYLTANLNKEQYRVQIRHDDEEINFHPQVVAFFETNNWHVDHHVRQFLGSQVDVIAKFDNDIAHGVFIIECKPYLSRQKFYTAVGQVLCYCANYEEVAIPVIATCFSQIDDFVRLCCQNLGIRLLVLDCLEQTEIVYDSFRGFDLVIDKTFSPIHKIELAQ